ncbi:pectinesterase [Ranunculus cassubicifolius]
MGKVVLASIAHILTVGIVIGAVVVVKEGNEIAMDSLCADAYHPHLCRETLTPVANGDAKVVSPKASVEAALNATIKAVKLAIIDSKSLEKEVKDDFDAISLESCKRYIKMSAEDLEIVISMVSKSEMNVMDGFARESNIFLSAVLTYTSTCVGEMNNPKMKETLQGEVLLNTTRLAENGLAIVEGVAQFLDNVNISELSGKKSDRRLLDIEEDGYPTWLSVSDRKLLQVNGKRLSPDVTVSKNGDAEYKTITEALKAYRRPKHKEKFVIYIMKGVYEEYVNVTQSNVFMYGDGPNQTIITGNKNKKIMNIDTGRTPTFAAYGDGFMAKHMGFHNTAGSAGHQAIALLTNFRQAAFYDCSFDGYQDTLCYQTHKSFFRQCVISGTIDFIFGQGVALIQNSQIIVKMPTSTEFNKNVIFADGRMYKRQNTGLVIQNCTIQAVPELLASKVMKTYLGRPWGPYARTFIVNSEIPGFICPEGYDIWNAKDPHDTTADFREYANRGEHSDISARVKWPGVGVPTKRMLNQFRPARWIKAQVWLPQTGIPFDLEFIH